LIENVFPIFTKFIFDSEMCADAWIICTVIMSMNEQVLGEVVVPFLYIFVVAYLLSILFTSKSFDVLVCDFCLS